MRKRKASVARIEGRRESREGSALVASYGGRGTGDKAYDASRSSRC